MNKKDLKQPETPINLNIYQKLQKIQSEIKELIRTEENKFQKYFFFNELQILQLLKPLLKNNNLVILLSDDTTQPFIHEKDGKEHFIKYLKRLEIIDTEIPENRLLFNFWACGSNVDLAKAKGSTETYAIKYMLSKFFLIPVKDEADPDYKDHKNTEEKDKVKEILTAKRDLSVPITSTITNIIEKMDKNKNKYLLLLTDNLDNNIFVFDYRVEINRWPELIKGKTYIFHLEESNNNLLTLLDFQESN